MGTHPSQHRALRAQEEPRKGSEVLLCFPSCKRYGGSGVQGGDTWQWLSGFTQDSLASSPFCHLSFGLMELRWKVYPGARSRPKQWGGWSPRGRRESEAEASGAGASCPSLLLQLIAPTGFPGQGVGGTASALKDVSHALGGLMGREHVLERGWVSSGKRSFFA